MSSGDQNAATSSSFPAKVNSFRLKPEETGTGTDVDVVVVEFADRVQLSLTDTGKPGLILEVTAKGANNSQVSRLTKTIQIYVR